MLKGEICSKRWLIKSDMIRVRSLSIKDCMLTVYNDRYDEWDYTSSHCLNNYIDLVAAAAQHHRNCSKDFSHTIVQSQRGRSVDLAELDAFSKLCMAGDYGQ